TTDSNGETSIAINLNSGKYTATITFNNTEYNTKSKNINITIKNTVYGDNIIKIIRNDTQYYAIFTDNQGNPLTNTDVSFNINGVFYTRTTNENGIAKLNLNLDQGKYILTAINPQTGEKYANNITVIPSIIENNDLTKYHRNDSHYVVKILNKDGTVAGAGEKVTFNINGVFYERTTNKTGHAQLNINLQPGDYIITVEHDGCYVSNNIKVLPVLKAYNLVKKYGNSRPFSATLVDGMGNPLEGKTLTFNINGVFYNRTTNENGIANLNINLQAGKYIITTTYNEAIISNVVTII
ncbi:MAG: Ig-like domain repeat protein, partial [Methanobrevibacter sp.]|nr:Ig-like domain repeat protein [Methanobrevibacter sp.]